MKVLQVDWMVCMNIKIPTPDWSALDEETIEEQMQTQEQLKADEGVMIQDLMHQMVASNPAAIRYLKERFIETAIAAPGYDLLTIGMNQGQANMIQWIINKAEQNKK